VPAPPVVLPRVGRRFHSEEGDIEGRRKGFLVRSARRTVAGRPDPDWAPFVMDFDYSQRLKAMAGD